jgi:hypothetical protein
MLQIPEIMIINYGYFSSLIPVTDKRHGRQVFSSMGEPLRRDVLFLIRMGSFTAV